MGIKRRTKHSFELGNRRGHHNRELKTCNLASSIQDRHVFLKDISTFEIAVSNYQ
jgi:hypothetical protein